MIIFCNMKRPAEITSFHTISSMDGHMSLIFKTYYFRVKPGSGNYARTTLITKDYSTKYIDFNHFYPCNFFQEKIMHKNC